MALKTTFPDRLSWLAVIRKPPPRSGGVVTSGEVQISSNSGGQPGLYAARRCDRRVGRADPWRLTTKKLPPSNVAYRGNNT